MAFTTKLFQIVISNNYYKSNNAGNDFGIVPAPSTVYWMEQRRVRMLYHSDGIELIWLSQNYDNPLELFKKKTDGIILSFVMMLKNNQALNFLELEAGHPTGQVYYLHNRHTNNNDLLHCQDFMSASDLVKIQEVVHYPTQPGWDVFGLIDIDLSHWANKLSRQENRLLEGFPIYKIKVQNRATFWRYYLVGTKQRLSGTLRILAQGDPTCFSSVKVAREFPNAYCAESITPLKLCDQYDHFFSLCKLDKSEEKKETVLLDKLPYPMPDSLKKDKTNKKKFYSDIVVYV